MDKKYDKPFQPDPVIEGERVYTLTKVKDCMLPVFTKTSQGYMKTTETKPGLRFVFKDNNRKSWVCHAVNKGVSDKSALFKFLQQCYNSLLNQEVKFRKEGTWTACEPEGRLISLAHQLTGMEFKIDVELKDGKWAKIKFITPITAPRIEATLDYDPQDINFGNQNQLTLEELAKNTAPIEEGGITEDDIPW
jgi:hypothetical protein